MAIIVGLLTAFWEFMHFQKERFVRKDITAGTIRNYLKRLISNRTRLPYMSKEGAIEIIIA